MVSQNPFGSAHPPTLNAFVLSCACSLFVCSLVRFGSDSAGGRRRTGGGGPSAPVGTDALRTHNELVQLVRQTRFARLVWFARSFGAAIAGRNGTETCWQAAIASNLLGKADAKPNDTLLQIVVTSRQHSTPPVDGTN